MIPIIVIKMRGVNDVMKRKEERKKKFITYTSASSATDE